MTATQISVLQLDNYGPWTVTPEPRREMDLQTLQSRLYADVADYLGSRGAYVFPARFDNMIAVTNGVDADGLASLQESIDNRYPVSMSVSSAVGSTPAEALAAASERLQRAGSAQDPDRRRRLCGTTTAPDEGSPTDLRVAHFDVVDATERYTDRLHAFDAYVAIDGAYRALREVLYDEHGALSFFVGGDNVVAICPDLSPLDYDLALDAVRDRRSVDLRVGVGGGETACDAGSSAKEALERCRRDGSLVEFASVPKKA